MACRNGITFNSGFVAFWFLRGSGPVLLRILNFCVFFLGGGGGGPDRPTPPSLDPRMINMSLSWICRLFFYVCCLYAQYRLKRSSLISVHIVGFICYQKHKQKREQTTKSWLAGKLATLNHSSNLVVWLMRRDEYAIHEPNPFYMFAFNPLSASQRPAADDNFHDIFPNFGKK